MAKIKLFFRELLNFISNCAVPIISAVCAIAEALHLPKKVLQVIKRAEYFCFYAKGTVDAISDLGKKETHTHASNG